VDTVEAAAILRVWLEEAVSKGYERLALLASIDRRDWGEPRGGSGTKYQLEILYLWDSRPGGAVLVMGSIDDGGLSAFAPFTKSVLVAPPARSGE
jgi:hypothetical protein